MLNNPFFLHKQVKILLVKILNIFLVKLFFFYFFILLKKNFVALGEHGFSFFQVKMFTGSGSVLLTSTSLEIKKKKNKIKLDMLS